MSDAIVALLSAANIEVQSSLVKELEARRDIFEATAKTEAAALTPQDPGKLTHVERAALAARMARLNNDPSMARYYEARVAGVEDVALSAPETLPGIDGGMAALVRHVDLVTTRPRDATGDDIDVLKAAGWHESDIVRISELIAFVNYQLRLVAGLRLMSIST